MKIRTSVFLAVSLAIGAVSAAQTRTATYEERERCEAPINRHIDEINDRLRKDYSGSEGELLRKQLRDLQDRKARCRTVN